MSNLNRELVFLMLQFLQEQNFEETFHKLEQESGVFFNMKYFEKKVLAGHWDDIEKYLSGFTKVDDNRHSMKIFYEIRKQKYLEALNRQDKARAVEILAKDFKFLQTSNEELFTEITKLLIFDNIRENEEVSKQADTKSARSRILVELKNLIEVNPLFRDKLLFPTLMPSRLHTMIIHSLYWQHQMCKHPRPVPEINLFADHTCSLFSPDDLPRTVVCTLHQESAVTSMDFHPSFHSLLTVGCSDGEIVNWEVAMRERLIKPFKTWDIAACTVLFQATFKEDSSISVSHVSWSPDGNFVGVAFTKHLIHLYAYQRSSDLRQHLEIDAHVGSVNDLTFTYPNKKLTVVTCGDDKLIKVWDMRGRRLFRFEGHEAPIYSICTRKKEKVSFIISTDVNGKIKVWLYDNLAPTAHYDAPGMSCTTIRYSADGIRLFSCGTSRHGHCYLVEWNEREGFIRRKYSGFRKISDGVVQFDTAKNCFLAAGEDNKIKFWGMDHSNLLTSTDAEGGLPNLPRLRFNKEGNLLAVTTMDSGLKVLANADGFKYLRAINTNRADSLSLRIKKQ